MLELQNYLSSMFGDYLNFYQDIKVTKNNASKEALLEGACATIKCEKGVTNDAFYSK